MRQIDHAWQLSRRIIAVGKAFRGSAYFTNQKLLTRLLDDPAVNGAEESLWVGERIIKGTQVTAYPCSEEAHVQLNRARRQVGRERGRGPHRNHELLTNTNRSVSNRPDADAKEAHGRVWSAMQLAQREAESECTISTVLCRQSAVFVINPGDGDHRPDDSRHRPPGLFQDQQQARQRFVQALQGVVKLVGEKTMLETQLNRSDRDGVHVRQPLLETVVLRCNDDR